MRTHSFIHTRAHKHSTSCAHALWHTRARTRARTCSSSRRASWVGSEPERALLAAWSSWRRVRMPSSDGSEPERRHMPTCTESRVSTYPGSVAEVPRPGGRVPEREVCERSSRSSEGTEPIWVGSEPETALNDRSSVDKLCSAPSCVQLPRSPVALLPDAPAGRARALCLSAEGGSHARAEGRAVCGNAPRKEMLTMRPKKQSGPSRTASHGSTQPTPNHRTVHGSDTPDASQESLRSQCGPPSSRKSERSADLSAARVGMDVDQSTQ
jgi:hypothetical protein